MVEEVVSLFRSDTPTSFCCRGKHGGASALETLFWRRVFGLIGYVARVGCLRSGRATFCTAGESPFEAASALILALIHIARQIDWRVAGRPTVDIS